MPDFTNFSTSSSSSSTRLGGAGGAGAFIDDNVPEMFRNAAAAAAAAEDEFHNSFLSPGVRVILTGLKAKRELNGATGTTKTQQTTSTGTRWVIAVV